MIQSIISRANALPDQFVCEDIVFEDIVFEDHGHSAPGRRSFRGILIAWGLSLAALGICLQALCILLSQLNPWLELANHLVVHGIGAGLILLPMLLYFRMRWAALGVGLSLGYLVFLWQPWALYFNEPNAFGMQPLPSIKILSWNVQMGNRNYLEIESIIREADADVLIILETVPGFLGDLAGVLEEYPLRQTHLHWSGGGICMFSRLPGTSFEMQDFGYAQQPAIIARIPRPDGAASELSGDTELTGDTGLWLVGMHAPNPLTHAAERDRQLSQLERWSQLTAGPICVCGDLNTTPWTGPFVKLQSAGFRDSRLGVGNLPTWPAGLGLLGIPIDHALSKRCTISDRRVVDRSAGSDHRPLTFRLHY